jgi:hypothetical protein
MSSAVIRPDAELSSLSAKETKALEEMRALFADVAYPEKEDPCTCYLYLLST